MPRTASVCWAKYSYICRGSSTLHSFRIHQSNSDSSSSGTATADVISTLPFCSWTCTNATMTLGSYLMLVSFNCALQPDTGS
eukprot:919334-Amphidinium_carterae.4